MIPLEYLKNEIINRQMDVEELLYERLGMDLEDVVNELGFRIEERRDHFEDIEERLEI